MLCYAVLYDVDHVMEVGVLLQRGPFHAAVPGMMMMALTISMTIMNSSGGGSDGSRSNSR